MKKFILLFLFSITVKFSFSQSCNTIFSFGAYFDKVYFYNYSNTQNAHYYWDFGDCSSSNHKNPIHIYPGSGKFLVTLYSWDTLTNCSNYFETWITIDKANDMCNQKIRDSIYLTNTNPQFKQLTLIEEYLNCTSYPKQFHIGGGNGVGSNNTFNLGDPNINPATNFIGFVRYYSLNSFGIKTIPMNFNKAKNYTPCSANFEFSILKTDSFDQVIHFKAMNKNALHYTWYFTGFGDPIIKNTDTANISYFANYNLISNTNPNFATTAPITLVTEDLNGCKDSLIQYVHISSPQNTSVGLQDNFLEALNFSFYPNPVKDKLLLQFNEQTNKDISVKITNSLGQLVNVEENIRSGTHLNLSYLAGGVYFITVFSSEHSGTYKFLKE